MRQRAAMRLKSFQQHMGLMRKQRQMWNGGRVTGTPAQEKQVSRSDAAWAVFKFDLVSFHLTVLCYQGTQSVGRPCHMNSTGYYSDFLKSGIPCSGKALQHVYGFSIWSGVVPAFMTTTCHMLYASPCCQASEGKGDIQLPLNNKFAVSRVQLASAVSVSAKTTTNPPASRTSLLSASKSHTLIKQNWQDQSMCLVQSQN